MERVSHLASHLTSSASGKEALVQKHPDDVVVVAAYRTAITKGRKGGFKDTETIELLAKLLKGLLEKTKIDPKLVDDVACGNVLNIGSGVTEHRAACLAAGLPYTTSFMAINRQCGSGLMAVNDIANKISAGQIDVGIGCGVESMTNAPKGNMAGNMKLPEEFLQNPEVRKCGIPMGITNENIAEKYNISREVQDKFAAASYNKAEKAQKTGLFKEEIIPIEVTIKDQDGNAKKVVVEHDDGIRYGVTAESLGKIKPAFKKDGTTSAGNASQVSDGAGAVLLMRRSVAERYGYTPIAKFVDMACVGVPPEIMGVGPAYAIPKLLEKVNLAVDDVDIYEINEAFAGQAVFCIDKVGIDYKKVNPKGGAIAFGHPLGATGARQVATLVTELKRTGKKFGVTSMCMGTGMGAAALFVAE